MEFQQTDCRFLRRVGRETANQEQTLEVRLPESMPDIGRVLGAWGQPLIRSKEWRSGSMGLSGGVMAWVLYAPEDGTDPRGIEAWIPFQKNWDFPESQMDGILRMACSLSSMDARSLSARKLMLRAGVSFLAEALEPGQEKLYVPPQLPEDVQLLEQTYPVILPREAGEKSFAVDEELPLPGELAGGEKLIYCTLHPELTDQKIMGDKAVFRGSALGHALLRDREGKLRGWDFEVPFSQYAQLDREYGPDCLLDLLSAVTNLETELQEGGTLRLKAGIVGQYLVYDRSVISVVMDAYSPSREVKPALTMLSLPALLEQTDRTMTAQRPWEQEEQEPLDVSFLLAQPDVSREGENWMLDMNGHFGVLSAAPDGSIQGAGYKWEEGKEIPSGKDARLFAWAQISGRPKAQGGELRCDVRTQLSFTADTQIPMVSALELGEILPPDPNRPSLILRRCNGEGLWVLAKQTGTTVEAIRQANSLSGDPEPNRLLLIPVP